MKTLALLPALLCSLFTFAQPRLGKNSIKEVIAAMTVEEKINLVIGTGMNIPDLPKEMQAPVVGQMQGKVPGAAGATYAIPRLGIPSIVVADGPAGLRIQPFRDGDSSHSFYCTAFPIGTLLASSWDTVLVRKVGAAIGNEVREYGVDILLGPALNIQRNPLGGRNFEYYSEDPVLAGNIAAAMVNGVQSQGVGTSIKHFAANNHEFNRNKMNVVASERTLREIYLRAFQTTLQHANPWTVMSSYNKINGVYTSESSDLLTTILRGEWRYNGLVMTDWFGGADPVAQLNAGNDLLMPGTARQQELLRQAVRDHRLEEAVLDKSVERILRLIMLTPTFKNLSYSNRPDLKAHALMARSAAADGMVLLKNENSTLPFNENIRSVAVFGNASYDMVTGGTGSGDVHEAYTVSLTDGLKNSGYGFDVNLKDIYSSYLADQQSKRPKMANPFLLPPPIPEMVLDQGYITQIAKAYDMGLITVGRNSGEFADRKLANDFNLSDTERTLIRNVSHAFHELGKKVVVILNIGGVVETASWSTDADAVLLAWQPGQEAGNAICDVLAGRVNPSGKLTSTFPVGYADVPSAANFPGRLTEAIDSTNKNLIAATASEVVYEEGIYIGYRQFAKAYDTKPPAYEFGYGLSYTTFGYGQLATSTKTFSGKLMVSLEVTNTGHNAGKEVVQLYLTKPGKSIDVAPIELIAFAKTGLLQPGKKQTVRFTINAQSLASYDEASASWIAEAGTYVLKAGSSSKNILQTATFTLLQPLVPERVHKALVRQ